MLNKIIQLSLRNRVVVIILAGLLLLAGTTVLLRMEVDIFPDLNAPTVVVMTEAPGFAPEEVEKLVTFPVETAVNGATDVRRVRSSSATGFSVVWVEFDWGTDIYRARQIVSEKLAAVAETLPPGVSTPVLGPQSSILGEIMIIGLTSDSTSMGDLRTLADRVIRPRLLAMGGVSQVSVIGGDIKEYQIKIEPERMRHYNVSLTEILDAASQVNANAGGGVLYEYGNEYIIKGDVNTSSVNAIGKSVVRSDERGTVLLEDVATVATGNKLPRIGVASERTKPAVLITVTKQPGTGTIALTERIEDELAVMRHTLPSDVNVSTDIFKQSDFIDNSISNLQQSLFEGSIFVIVILFFFLMNVRTTLISLIALPLSIIVTVLVLHFLGFSINTMSLGGIAIAIGSLVDDAIVDVENVYKRLRENRKLPEDKRRRTIDVVFEASKEVRMPIFNSSLIIIASFLPLFFLQGIEGRMLIPLGISFIVALIASTIVALTLTPVLCSYLLNNPGQEKLSNEPWATRKLKAAYSKALGFSFAHKKGVLIVTGALFALSIGLFFTLGRSFLPSFNEGSFTINVSSLPGISLDESDKIGRMAEEMILSVPEVKTVARKTGRAELDEHSLGVNVSEIEAPYKLDKRSREEVVRELRAKLSEIPGVNIEIGQPISHRIDAMLSGTEAQIAIKVFGDDLEKLYSLGTDIKKSISKIPGIVDINIEQQIGRPQLDLRPRREMLARYGIPVSKFVEFVDVALAGQVVSQVYENGLPYDLTVIVDDNLRNSMENISNLMIDSNQGKIPLSYVADIVSTTGPNTINRENVSRRIVIAANVDGRDLRGAVNDIIKTVDK
ncbi:efflux RND transporter permease subunit, partial [uncultured Muribaculum sp.]